MTAVSPSNHSSTYEFGFKLAGVHSWIPSLVLIVVGFGFMWLSVVIAKRLMSGADVFLPGLLFLTCGYFWWLDGTHHWFSSFCVLAAVASSWTTGARRGFWQRAGFAAWPFASRNSAA